jgi:hypothetical protein
MNAGWSVGLAGAFLLTFTAALAVFNVVVTALGLAVGILG